jgi:formylglycine-generating enzyme required for sulfatase activity
MHTSSSKSKWAIILCVAVLVGVAYWQSEAVTEKKRETNVDIQMVLVCGGTFTMGCTGEQDGDCYGNESQAHQVTLRSFYIEKYEVTQVQWEAVMVSNPSDFEGDNLPVENVSWDDVQEFISKLNAKTGKNYRLPTEAEWEYAARGGAQSKGYKYSGSNNVGEVAWYKGNSGSVTHTIGTKAPNELGLYDMSGNVWEWCSDWGGAYSASAQTNPTGPSSGSNRVIRGGSWSNIAQYVRVPIRYNYMPGDRYSRLGFRLARSSN